MISEPWVSADVRARPEVALPAFLPFFRQSDIFMDRAQQISVGSLSPTINWKTLANQEFALPPLAEQRRIMTALHPIEAARNAALQALEAGKSVFVESFVRDALVHLNPEIAENPDSAALDQHLPPEASDIVISVSGKEKEDAGYKPYKRHLDAEEKLLDRFRDPKDPLQLLVVTAKLLTGFDAPILQAMYPDKPARDHTLLQAICRTNRTYGDTKSHGLIVDYLGVFDDVAKALEFDEKGFRQVVSNIAGLKDKLPGAVQKCLAYFAGCDRALTGYEGLIAAQECLPDNATRDEIKSAARLRKHMGNPRFKTLSERLEKLKERHEAGQLHSIASTSSTATRSSSRRHTATSSSTTELRRRLGA